MKLQTSKKIAEWLAYKVFPVMEQMAEARKALHAVNDAEYWNAVIVASVLDGISDKLHTKMQQKRFFFALHLTDAEAYCLYRFLFNFPIPENFHWGIMQRQQICNDIHRELISEHLKFTTHETDRSTTNYF